MMFDGHDRGLIRSVGVAAAVLHLSMVSAGFLAHAQVHLRVADTAKQVQAQTESGASGSIHHHCAICQTLAGSCAMPDSPCGAISLGGNESIAPLAQPLFRTQDCAFVPLGARAPPLS